MDNFLSVLYVMLLLLWPVEPTWIGEMATEEEWIILQQISYHLEICSPGVEHWRDSWKVEIYWCRHAWKTSWYLPPLAWSSYLPDYSVCRANECFARRRFDYFTSAHVDPRMVPTWSLLVKDQEERALIWSWAADATDPKRPAVRRRNCIAALLDYQREGLPCHVNMAYYTEK